MSDYPFRLICRELREPRGAEVAEHLRARPATTHTGTLAATCQLYRPSAELEIAMNAAIAIGAPLLLTGEPGTGKTQLAKSVAAELGLDRPLRFDTKSTSTAKDLFYTFDAVGRFHARRGENRQRQPGRAVHRVARPGAAGDRCQLRREPAGPTPHHGQ